MFKGEIVLNRAKVKEETGWEWSPYRCSSSNNNSMKVIHSGCLSGFIF